MRSSANTRDTVFKAMQQVHRELNLHHSTEKHVTPTSSDKDASSIANLPEDQLKAHLQNNGRWISLES